MIANDNVSFASVDIFCANGLPIELEHGWKIGQKIAPNPASFPVITKDQNDQDRDAHRGIQVKKGK